MRTLVRSAVLVVLTLGTLAMYAALTQKYADWGKGPATWLMTRDEQKKWRTLTTDDDAQAFIDLFWARRDPTPGTFVNEYKAEFDARVKYADDNLGDRGTRGSMTDRGRALIVLGWPSTTDSAAGQQRGMGTTNAPSGDAQDGGASGAGVRGVRLGAREVWLWEKADAQKFNMPKVEAVYIQDIHTGVWQRDTQRNEIMGAFPVAIEKAIVNKDLTVAPEWSKRPATEVAFVPQKTGSQGPAKALRKGDPGAHGLVLVKNAMGLAAPQGGSDPFAGVQTINLFEKTDDLGYAFEYCGASESVKMTINIRGTSDGKKVNMVAPTEEVPVEAIKAVPGCAMVRASIPLNDMQVLPGTYTFNLKLEDGPQSWNLAQDFKVQ